MADSETTGVAPESNVAREDGAIETHRAADISGSNLSSLSRRSVVVAVVAVLLVTAVALGWLFTRAGDEADVSAGTTATADPTTVSVAFDGTVSANGASLPPLAGGSDPAVGSTVPVLTGPAPDGSRVVIGGDTEPRLLMVTAHWCGHCQAELPRVVDLADSSGRIDGVEVVAIASSHDPARGNFPASDWFESEGWGGRLMIDDHASTALVALGGTAFPYWLAVDATGRLAARAAGEMEPESLRALAAIAAGDVTTAPSDATVTVLAVGRGDENAAFEAGAMC